MSRCLLSVVRTWTSLSMGLLAAACGQSGPGSFRQSDYQHAAVDEPDGSVSLYSGIFIADRIAQGYDVESLDSRGSFARLRVPRAMLDGALASPTQRVLISLEAPYPGVEILLHDFDLSSPPPRPITRYTPPWMPPMKNATYVPGEPWLSGRAEVSIDDLGQFVGGVHILKYSGTPSMSLTDFSFNLLDCTDGEPDCPTLRYSNQDPCRWPAVPGDWTLVSDTGTPTSLDSLCGRD